MQLLLGEASEMTCDTLDKTPVHLYSFGNMTRCTWDKMCAGSMEAASAAIIYSSRLDTAAPCLSSPSYPNFQPPFSKQSQNKRSSHMEINNKTFLPTINCKQHTGNHKIPINWYRPKHVVCFKILDLEEWKIKWWKSNYIVKGICTGVVQLLHRSITHWQFIIILPKVIWEKVTSQISIKLHSCQWPKSKSNCNRRRCSSASKRETMTAVVVHRFITVLKVLLTASQCVPYPLTLGGSGVLPSSRYRTPRANQRAAPGRYGLSLVGAIGWSGAGSETERWLMSVPQALLTGWSSFQRFEPGVPPTAAWRRRRRIVTALETSSRCPPGDWDPKLGLRFIGFSPLHNKNMISGISGHRSSMLVTLVDLWGEISYTSIL